MNVILIGFMGTQKTQAGKILAGLLDFDFIDMDLEIEKQEGMRIKDIFKEHGEEYFRRVESEIAKEIGKLDRYVVSTGGGVVLKEENMKQLSGAFVHLTCEPDEIYNRVYGDESRPVISGQDKSGIGNIYEKRMPIYQKYANIVIDTTSITPKETARLIVNELHTKSTF